jgi:hypothetical protein
MSLLPQHKKSAEEIAKLRESLGIPGHTPDEEGVIAETAPPEPAPDVLEISGATHPKEIEKSVATLTSPLPLADAHTPRQVHSLRRSDRIPVLPVADLTPEESATIEEPDPLPPVRTPKPVRSLRKSEQVPLAAISPPSPDSTLPFHRHSDKELHEIRRQEALAILTPAVHPLSLTAHKALIIPGYLFALAGALCYYYYNLEIQFALGCVVGSLLIAAFIFFKKPLSRHHAAFISVAALFVIIFGTLHYFPNLQYGT